MELDRVKFSEPPGVSFVDRYVDCTCDYPCFVDSPCNQYRVMVRVSTISCAGAMCLMYMLSMHVCS